MSMTPINASNLSVESVETVETVESVETPFHPLLIQLKFFRNPEIEPVISSVESVENRFNTFQHFFNTCFFVSQIYNSSPLYPSSVETFPSFPISLYLSFFSFYYNFSFLSLVLSFIPMVISYIPIEYRNISIWNRNIGHFVLYGNMENGFTEIGYMEYWIWNIRYVIGFKFLILSGYSSNRYISTGNRNISNGGMEYV